MTPGSAAASRHALRRSLVVAALVAATFVVPAHATADGPDHYRVRGVAAGSVVNLRAEPSTSAPRLARIPADATCLRNLGCRGGLTFEEFTTLSETEQRKRAQANPRWCKVDYRGTVGWVAGRYLAEDGCTATAAPATGR
jgi:uncharacterized protein YraI